MCISVNQNSGKDVIAENTSIENVDTELLPLYDSKLAGKEDKFVSTILNGVLNKERSNDVCNKVQLFTKWQQQSDFEFVFIPPEKLKQINDIINQWQGKHTCTKRQLQSILGLLLYIHKQDA